MTEGVESIECESTNDMLNKINAAEEELEKNVDENVEIIATSADAVALYPSTTKKVAGNDVFKMVMESEITIDNLNYEAGAKYVAVACTRGEIFEAGLSHVVPCRKWKRGPTPGFNSPEIMTRNLTKDGTKKLEKKIMEGKKAVTDKKGSVWRSIPILNEVDKKTLTAMVMKTAVMQIMSNHVFEFGGRTYLQSDGGSIGLRLTGAVCRVVMDRWVK